MSNESNSPVMDSVVLKGVLAIKNGKIKIVDSLTAIAAQNVTITNVGCAGIGTATITAWLEIDVAGTLYYIPCWT